MLRRYKIGLAVLVTVLICSIWYFKSAQNAGDALSKETIFAWNQLLLDLERFTSGYKGPITARMFAYTSLTAYESALPSFQGYHSLDTRFKGYERQMWQTDVPQFLPAASLNAAYAAIARKFFPGAPPELQSKINEYERVFSEKTGALADETSLAASRNFGRRTADAVWRWSQSDSIGYGGQAFCSTCGFVPDTSVGHWRLEDDKLFMPMLPFWGKVRPFFVQISQVNITPPPAYSESPGSQLFGDAMEVFTSSQMLNAEAYKISQFWNDEVKGLTVSTPGRWISIATQAAMQSDIDVAELLDLYLRLSAAMSDAYIICWDLKYKYQQERPETYIVRVIQPEWRPNVPAPPHPSYPSGHSAVSAASAEVLIRTFGDNFTITDHTLDGREDLSGAARTYHSFREMSKEVAWSRILLGVHFRTDCEEGLRIGQQIGEKIAHLEFGEN